MSKTKEKATRIAWHPGFCSATEHALQGEEGLSFESEHNLSKEPLRIDLLIIKKLTDQPLESDIGRLFRKYNVIEYKSPGDGLSIDDFYKVTAYAALYKATAKKVNEIPAEEVTVSLFHEGYPRKLAQMLLNAGSEIVRTAPGVYEDVRVKSMTVGCSHPNWHTWDPQNMSK